MAVSEALLQIFQRDFARQRSRAPNVSYTNGRGRRYTAEEESAGAIIGSMTEIDASSCIESVQVTYTPPDPATPPTTP